MQEITWLIVNDADIEGSKAVELDDRSPFIEFWVPNLEKPEMDRLPLTPPRILKTHLPAAYFEKRIQNVGLKVIVMMRNAKDSIASYYNFYRNNSMFGNFNGSWDEFFELFKRMRLGHGDWADHCLGWWKLKDYPNVLVLYYEDLKKDPFKVIKQISNHLNKDLSDTQIQRIVEHTSLQKMRENEGPQRKDFIRSFFRKGEVGDWKRYFTAEQSAYVDDYVESTVSLAGMKFDMN